MPRSVAIQPRLSFRKNSDTGLSLSFCIDHVWPPSLVETMTGFAELSPSSVPTARPRRTVGNFMSLSESVE